MANEPNHEKIEKIGEIGEIGEILLSFNLATVGAQQERCILENNPDQVGSTRMTLTGQPSTAVSMSFKPMASAVAFNTKRCFWPLVRREHP